MIGSLPSDGTAWHNTFEGLNNGMTCRTWPPRPAGQCLIGWEWPDLPAWQQPGCWQQL